MGDFDVWPSQANLGVKDATCAHTAASAKGHETRSTHLVDSAHGVRGPPLLRAVPRVHVDVCRPVRHLLCASEHDGDHVVVRRDKGLRVLDCVKYASFRFLFRLVDPTSNTHRPIEKKTMLSKPTCLSRWGGRFLEYGQTHPSMFSAGADAIGRNSNMPVAAC